MKLFGSRARAVREVYKFYKSWITRRINDAHQYEHEIF